MTDKIIIACDLCGREINDRGNGNAMIIAGGRCQVWPTKTGNKDVCRSCCSILAKAAEYGIVEYDEDPLFLRAGFTKRNHLWIAPSYMDMYGDQVK